MGRYFIEECEGERTLYYQPYEGEWMMDEFFTRPLFKETMGLVQARKIDSRHGIVAAYQINGQKTVEQVLQGGIEEEELLMILTVMTETAERLQEIKGVYERLLFQTSCIFCNDAKREVFYILHTGSYELRCPDFFTCIKSVLAAAQINSEQYGVDKLVESYLEEQKEVVLADFAQYLRNIRSQLFLTKNYSGQQSLSCRLGDSNIMIDELFSIEAPKFSTVKMMEQESAKKRGYLVRVQTKERVEITKAIFTIGKEAESDYRIADNNAISRKHASIIFREDGYYIKDLDSTNHTFVNRRLIRSPEEIKLESGMNLMLANEMFVYQEE